MSTFERYLTIWVFLCIVVGVALGHLMPGVFQVIGAAEIAKVNLPVAILIWLGALHLCFRGIDTRFPQKARKTHPWRATLRHDFLQRGNVPTRQDQRRQCEAPSVHAIERGGAQ